MSSAPAASCWAPLPPAVTKSSSILSCLSQPSSVAMYCGHCGGPCATIPATILVCAGAAPADRFARTADARASAPPRYHLRGTGDINISMHVLLRCAAVQASKLTNTELYIFRVLLPHYSI